MKETIGTSRAYRLTMVTTCKMRGHKVLVMVANLFNEEVQEHGNQEVVEVVGVMDHQEVNTEVEYVDRDHQEETMAIGAPTGATMVMGTKTSKTLDTEIAPIEADTEMVTEVR